MDAISRGLRQIYSPILVEITVKMCQFTKGAATDSQRVSLRFFFPL